MQVRSLMMVAAFAASSGCVEDGPVAEFDFGLTARANGQPSGSAFKCAGDSGLTDLAGLDPNLSIGATREEVIDQPFVGIEPISESEYLVKVFGRWPGHDDKAGTVFEAIVTRADAYRAMNEAVSLSFTHDGVTYELTYWTPAVARATCER